MAKIFEMELVQQVMWLAYLRALPIDARALAERFPPGVLYRLRGLGVRVFVSGLGSEPDSLIVDIVGRFNLIAPNLRCLNVPHSELEDCVLPLPNECLGEDDPAVGNICIWPLLPEILASGRFKVDTPNHTLH